MKTFALVAALLTAAGPAAATRFVYTYEGHLPVGTSLGGTTLASPTLASPTPFVFHAVFDDTGTNLAGPVGVPDFVAYAPVWATLSAAGQHYQLKPWDGTSGIAISIFGASTPFGPRHVASGFIQDIANDGAGIVGDWLATATNAPFDAGGALQPFRMSGTDFFGVGYGAGTPAPLSDGGWTIGLPGVDETYIAYSGYPHVSPPFITSRDTAILSAPEPAAFALFGLGGFALVTARRRR